MREDPGPKIAQVSTTDPDDHLAAKGPGKEPRLCFMGRA